MSKILEVINKFRKDLKQENGFTGDIFFSEDGTLDMDENLLSFYLGKINKEFFNEETVLESKDLILAFHSLVPVENNKNEMNNNRILILFDDFAMYAFYYEPANEEFDEQSYLDIIFWEDVREVKLKYKKDDFPKYKFIFKVGIENDNFYEELKEKGLYAIELTAKSNFASKLLVEMFRDIIEVFKRNQIELIQELFEEEKYDEVIDNLEKLDKEEYRSHYYYHFYRLLVFNATDGKSKLLNEANEFKRYFDINEILYNSDLALLFSMAYEGINDNLNVIKWGTYGLQSEVLELEAINDYFSKNGESILDESYEMLKKDFSEIPFQKRKFILTSNQLIHCDLEGFVVLKTNDMPEGIKFPLTHPHLNEVYTCHPIKDKSYIPLKNYQKELFVDKLREFLLLLDVLGATKIDVINKNKSVNNTQNRTDNNIVGSLGFKGSGGKVGYENQSDDTRDLEQELNIAFHQKLIPKKRPYLPDNLYWFHTDLNWQRMAQQRMNGSVSSHKEMFSSKQIESLSSHELTKVNAELKVLFAKANVNYENDVYTKTSSEKHFNLDIQVEFENLANLKEVHSNSESNFLANDRSIKSNRNKINLDNYKEDIAFMLEDDGVIDEAERKLLNRKMEKYGLSKEEAEQIEKELLFNSDELKYINEYKMLLEEGEIGEMERKMLERYAQRYDVNEERQNILEKSVIKNQ